MDTQYTYICNRCGVEFTISHEVYESGAVCTPCFDYIRGATSADDYYARRAPIQREGDN